MSCGRFIVCGILLLNLLVVIESCQISEFPCKSTGVCLPLDKYCDGIDHCGDLSDEPKFCTGKFHFFRLKFKLILKKTLLLPFLSL